MVHFLGQEDMIVVHVPQHGNRADQVTQRNIRKISCRGRRVGVLGLVALWVLLSIGSPAVRAASWAYIANSESNNVSVIDTATPAVVATIPVGSGPFGVAVHPTGNFAYVTNRFSGGSVLTPHPGTISVIDTVSRTVVATPTVGEMPRTVAVHPAGGKVYVGNEDLTISVIDTTTHRVKRTVDVPGQSLADLAMHPSGERLYATGVSGLTVIETARDTPLTTIPLTGGAYGAAVDPQGRFVYVTSGCIVLDWDDFELTSFFVVIDAATEQVVASVPIPCGASGVAVHPTGTPVYVANGYYPTVSVYVIDPATYAIGATMVLPVLWDRDVVPVSWPVGIAVHPEGTWVYVVNIAGESDSIGTVAVLDTTTHTLATSIPVGAGPITLGQFIGATVSGSCLGTSGGRINGTVRLGRSPLAGVTLTLNGSEHCSATMTTDAQGTYTFADLSDGTYTVTPSLVGCTGIPATRQATVGGRPARVNLHMTCR